MKNFIRIKENFTCQNCGQVVFGNGYTDHCPACLWGKHVDLETPGDRISDCHGLLKPIRVIFEKGKYRIYYTCLKCNHKFRVWADDNDNKQELIKLVQN